MGGTNTELTGPDFGKGVKAADVPEGAPLLGHADGEAVVLVRKGNDAFAVGATCTHYGGPLAEGIVEGDTRSDVPGTTPATACARARRSPHPRSTA